jgi:hypothetical protein
VKALPSGLDTIVSNQGQARELAKVQPEKRVEVLQQVAKAGPVTAVAIKEAAQEIAPYKPERYVSYRVSIVAVKKDLVTLFRHRPLEKTRLLAIAKLLENCHACITNVRKK